MPVVWPGAPHNLREVWETNFLRRVLRGLRAEAGGGVPEMPYQAGPPKAAVREVQERPAYLRQAGLVSGPS